MIAARIKTAALALLVLCLWGATLSTPRTASAQTAPATVQSLLQDNVDLIVEGSRLTVEPAIEALRDSGLPRAQEVLEGWQNKELWLNEATNQLVFVEDLGGRTYRMIDIMTGADLGTATSREVKQIKPNSGVRGLIGAALVRFQLTDPDAAVRLASLDAIERDPRDSHLGALRASIPTETVPEITADKIRLERLLTIRFDPDEGARIAAIESFGDDLGVDVRATLNPLLTTTLVAFAGEPDAALNLAGEVIPAEDSAILTPDDAYAMLVSAGLAEPAIDRDARKAALIANISDGKVAGIDVATLDTWATRDAAYAALAETGAVPPSVSEAGKAEAIAAHSYYQVYATASPALTTAARKTLDSIEGKVLINRLMDLALDGLSLASIYFLAAIGLAITFGVMRVINMAHGEFIMMGAYTGYVVQQIIPNYTASILVALPLAFAVTFAAGVAMERLVIRWLYNRPLETLLATFGISIALQQIAKNIFGTQARPLTAPDWLSGALVLNDVVSISYIRIAIFVLAMVFLVLLLVILTRTRLGLEVRAVTQNPRMADSMGINPARINMLTFGLGSGIAGIAGVAIGLYAKVTSELGADYIVQSFMTVVVGGVGNIWGTLLGATLIGFLQKSIEWFNPSNTLAAQTYMILFVILFIQIRPRGIIALKGRAADV